MKKIIMLLILMMLFSVAYAYDTNSCRDSNSLDSIGNCIVRGAFAGDTMFFAIIMLILFTIFMWESRIPAGATISISLLLFLAMSPFFGNLYTTMLNLMLLVIGVVVALAILHFIRR